MISVVIPLYNKEDFIAETLESVLHQSFQDFEIVVVDDGSTDGSVSVVQNIEDDRIHLITIENSGVSVARNTGIKTAKYNWVAFLDADDWWAPTFLEEMEKAILSYPKQKIFASGNTMVFKSFEDRLSSNLLPKDGETNVLNYFELLSNYIVPINSSNCVIEKKLLLKSGCFRKGQLQHEDHDLWMRLSKKNSIVFVNKNLSFYRKSIAGSASSKNYAANDFKTYLETILSVREQVTTKEQNYIDSYASRFSLLSYIKQYGNYTESERELLRKPLSSIISGKYKYIYKLSNLLPFDMYNILKFLKR